MVYEQVLAILAEAERSGQAHRKQLDAGETPERAADVAPFDFVRFWDALDRIMIENLAFFEKMSKDTTFMFLKNDFKNVLKQALLDHFRDREGDQGSYERELYVEFISAGAISLWTDWLQNRQVPLEKFRDAAVKILREAWKFGEAGG